MITDVEYMQIINEAYDLSDYSTKQKLIFCNESKKIENIEHIVNQLYIHIKDNCTAIDFGTIPRSKGSITHIDHYADILDCINSVHDLVIEYHEKTTIVDEISTAIDNIRQRERQFAKAFSLNIDLPIMIYNITTLSIVSAVSLLLSSTIEYVKNGHDSFTVAFDKVGYYKSKDHVLYEYIVQFNRNCANGTIDKIMSECTRNNVVAESTIVPVEEGVLKDALKGALDATIKAGRIDPNAVQTAANTISTGTKIGKVVAIIVGIGASAVALVWMIRKAVQFFFEFREATANWFEIQANYLQINAENLKYRDDDKGDDHKRQVYQKQMKWVNRFKQLANAFAIKDAKARKKVDEEERNRDRSYHDDDNDDGGLF